MRLHLSVDELVTRNPWKHHMGLITGLVDTLDINAGNTAAFGCGLDLLSEQNIPVVAGVGANESGRAYNVNADTVAGEIAAALKAEKIVFLTDVEGIYEDQGADVTPISECDLAYLGALQASGRIEGGMIPKVGAVRRALEAGVHSAHVIDGRVEHAVLLEILTDAGCGTKVTL